MDSQEWLSGNAKRRFPFAEASADATGVDLDALSNWLLDLRVFVSPYEEVECWISYIGFATGDPLSLGADNLTLGEHFLFLNGEPLDPEIAEGGSYIIKLSNNSGQIAAFIFPIQDVHGSSDFQTKRYAFNGRIVAVLSPGKGWDRPASIGLSALESTLYFNTPEEIESTRIHPANVNTDIRSFKGFYLAAPYYDAGGNLIEVDEEPPGLGEVPSVSINRIQAGYNIQLGQQGDFLDLNVVPGAGEGLYPCDNLECEPKVRKINGLVPNDQGNITLEFIDCLRHSGRTDIDPGTGLPSVHGLKIYSDCLPCCTCGDYNNTSLAISRMSMKFKEINGDMNELLLASQDAYDEAVAYINSRSPGMAVVYSYQVYSDRIEISVMNTSNVPIYAGVGLSWTGAGTLELDAGQPHVHPGINLGLGGLTPSSQDTGITDPNDVANWNPGTVQYTLALKGGGGPIPAGSTTSIVLFCQSARDKLEALTLICRRLQVYLGGSTGQAELDEDAAYQLLIAEFEALAILDPDCLGADLPGSEYKVTDEGFNDRYRCMVQAQGDALRRQEIRDDMLARKFELAFDVEICEENALLPATADFIAALRALKDVVGASCKDGSFVCTDLDTDAGEWNWKCSADLFGDTCQGTIRDQTVRRQKLYLAMEKVLRDQIYHMQQLLEECLSEGMFADLIDQIDISTVAIYGGDNLGCTAGNREIEVDRDPRFNSGFECLSEVVSVIAYSTQEPNITPPPP